MQKCRQRSYFTRGGEDDEDEDDDHNHTDDYHEFDVFPPVLPGDLRGRPFEGVRLKNMTETRLNTNNGRKFIT